MHAFDILGDPVRRRILELLAEDERTSGEVVAVIADELGISQPAVSQHLEVLSDNGLATVRAEGTRRIYVDAAPLAQVDRWLERFRHLWEPRLSALDTEIARGKRRQDQPMRRTDPCAAPRVAGRKVASRSVALFLVAAALLDCAKPTTPQQPSPPQEGPPEAAVVDGAHGPPDAAVVDGADGPPTAAAADAPRSPAPLSDRDHDGIPDNVDACPDQPGMASGIPRENGCVRGLIHAPCVPDASPRLTFARGSARPSAADERTVKILAEALDHHPEIVLVGVEGFTDAGEGAPSKLGMQRATAVADRLIAHGVAPGRITRAWGEGSPRTDCGGCPCRDIGRRIVQFVILQRSDAGPVEQFSRPAPKP